MIGIFDSGIGGISVMREIVKLLPRESYIYVSDAGHCPYGPKSKSYIIERADRITAYLIAQGAELVVVACNTATAAAISFLREKYSVPFVGMEPAVKPAALLSRSGTIGVLATKGTFGGSLYHHTLEKYASDVQVIETVGEGLVELAEQGMTDTPQARKVLASFIDPMLEKGADFVVLGCTHYPFFADTINDMYQGRITVVDPAPAVARRVEELVGHIRKSSVDPVPAVQDSRFLTTGTDLSVFEKMVSKHVGKGSFERVDI